MILYWGRFATVFGKISQHYLDSLHLCPFYMCVFTKIARRTDSTEWKKTKSTITITRKSVPCYLQARFIHSNPGFGFLSDWNYNLQDGVGKFVKPASGQTSDLLLPPMPQTDSTTSWACRGKYSKRCIVGSLSKESRSIYGFPGLQLLPLWFRIRRRDFLWRRHAAVASRNCRPFALCFSWTWAQS